MLNRFLAAWRFLTVIPLSPSVGGTDAESLRLSPPLFPAVGLALGLGMATAVGLLGSLFPPMATAAFAVCLLAAVSGGLHLDGLADCADALLSATHSRERALEIMKDSRIGAHGAMAVTLVLTVKFACLASIPPEALHRAVILVPLAGRAAMLPPMSLLPYLRRTGLGSLFAPLEPRACFTAAIAWVGVASLLLLGVGGLLPAVTLWFLVAAGWTRYLKRRLNGATGDCYGAACELAETAACLAAAAFH